MLRFCKGLHIQYFSRKDDPGKFDGIDKLLIEYSKFKVNFRKIVENIKSLEKKDRPRKDEILSTFSRNPWVKTTIEDYFQHSLRECSQCLKSDEPKKFLARSPVKTFTLRKGKGQWTLQRHHLKGLEKFSCNNT